MTAPSPRDRARNLAAELLNRARCEREEADRYALAELDALAEDDKGAAVMAETHGLVCRGKALGLEDAALAVQLLAGWLPGEP